MNILLLGPQGSGKGTQAELLVKNFGFNHFEAGKILRSIAASDNPNAKIIKDTLDQGGLVPDELVHLIAWDYLNKHDKTKGFVFDGYPRSLAQYDHLKDMLARFGQKMDLVIDLEISADETIKRLLLRQQLEQRSDDNPEAIQKRLATYRTTTHPVFLAAQAEDIGVEIDGMRPIEVIYKDLEKLIHAKD